ncbi:uncharacterized protein LOC131662471 isoform X2 [Vicia villosa]|uniref:uncharacterized protein LOC131662471 isoform X2 n=1 Tax=Vicia villosa TaxID=3911 RepID=UPI00273AF2BF|nr:uncharacterized protein LOC131662471 isoform X2 [Vicia villosa]XP_058788241.1 uncharacterized protein LOC131662471 isoform X2 [Vicia villosa]
MRTSNPNNQNVHSEGTGSELDVKGSNIDSHMFGGAEVFNADGKPPVETEALHDLSWRSDSVFHIASVLPDMTSVKSCFVGRDGVRHLILCRVILRRTQIGKPDTKQCYPTLSSILILILHILLYF